MQREVSGQRVRKAWLLGVALCGSCLVTRELDFQANSSSPVATPVSPPNAAPARVPSEDDPSCDNPSGGAMRFDVTLYDADVDPTLYVKVFVNGSAIEPAGRQANPIDDTPFYQLKAGDELCVPRTAFNLPCNRVQVIAGDVFSVTNEREPIAAGAPYNPRYSIVNWSVLGPAADTADAPGQPDLTDVDCAPPVERPVLDGGP